MLCVCGEESCHSQLLCGRRRWTVLSKPAKVLGTVCSRPPPAVAGATALLSDFLHKLPNEFIVLGDLNWDWLSTSSALRDICDALHLTQLVQSPTRLNPKQTDKYTLIDVILSNAPHKYSAAGVFCNDVSDHCMVACVRNCLMIRTKQQFIFK